MVLVPTLVLLLSVVNSPGLVDSLMTDPYLVKQNRARLIIPRTQLQASTAAWAVGHVLGGLTGTPIVARATSRWYNQIDLPEWTPPNRIFGPIWTCLYASMGVAASRVARQVGLKSVPMLLWACHYVLNLSWAPVFFGAKRLRLGLIINCIYLLPKR